MGGLTGRYGISNFQILTVFRVARPGQFRRGGFAIYADGLGGLCFPQGFLGMVLLIAGA